MYDNLTVTNYNEMLQYNDWIHQFIYVSTAKLNKSPQYSLGGVQAINGSDQHGGCPRNDVLTVHEDEDERVFGPPGSSYCASGMGVIFDGAIPIVDIQRPNWASGLLTVNRHLHSATLAFKFNSQVREIIHCMHALYTTDNRFRIG